MAYVGRGPRHGFLEGQTHTFNGSETTVTLERNVSSTDALDVFIDNVHQEPDVAYTLASGGDQLSFTGTPLSGQKLYVRFHGITFDTARAYRLINTPATSTLTLSDAHVLTLDLNGTTALTATTSGITIPNLTVTGTTTTVNSTQLNIGDNLITLNSDLDGSTAPSQNAGIEVNRGSSSDVSFLWDESADYWAAGEAIVSATRLSVFKSGTTPSLAATTLGVFKNSATSQNAAISIIANSGQSSLVNFGDENDEDVGQLSYSHVSDAFALNKNISVTGNIAVSGTVDGVDIAARDSVLTSTTTTAGAALPKAGGTMTGALNIEFSNDNGGVGGQLVKNTNTGTTANFASASYQAVNGAVQGTVGAAHYPAWGGSVAFVGTQTGHPLKFITSNAVRATVEANGNATFSGTISSGRITTTGGLFVDAPSGNPDITLKTAGAGNNPFIRIQAASNYWDIQTIFSNTDDELDFRYNGASKLEIDKNGNLTVSGTLKTSGDMTVTEDSKIKTVESSGGSFLQLRSDNLGVTDNSTALISLNDVVIGAKSNNAGTGIVYFGVGAEDKSDSNWVDTLTIAENGNATFAGTISSGAITTSGNVSVGGSAYTTSADLNLLGDGLAIKNDKNGSNNNWSLIQNTSSGGAANLVFTTGLGSALTLNHDRSATFDGEVIVNTTGPDTSASMGGQVPEFTVSGYSSIGGLRVNGSDGSNTIYMSGGNIGITNATHSIRLNTPSASIDLSAGNGDVQVQARLGVGTTSPRSDIRYTSGTAVSTKRWGFGGGITGTNDVFYIINEGNVGQYMAHGAQAWTAHSDERIKENIQDVGTVLPSLTNVRCVKYNLISNPDDTKIGFIAQDWESSFPEVVDEDDHLVLEADGTISTKDESDSTTLVKAMAYTETIPLLLKAIQELSAKVDEQAAKITALENN